MLAEPSSLPFACPAVPVSYDSLAVPKPRRSQDATFGSTYQSSTDNQPQLSPRTGAFAPYNIVASPPPPMLETSPIMAGTGFPGTSYGQIPSSFLWIVILLVAAGFLSLIVCAQIISTYTTAYLAAPHEVTAFVDAVDFSIQENESYDRDIQRAQRLEDKMRLGQLLREIQKCGDDLREDLNRITVGESGTTLRTSARVLWAGHKRGLEERMRRLDLLRMRFLVVYMGILSTAAGEREKQAQIKEKTAAAYNEKQDMARSMPLTPETPVRPSHLHALHQSLSEAITHKRPQLTRIKTHSQSMGHSDKRAQPQRMGWMGVVEELRRSPILKQRHASIEEAMRSPPMSPLGSPLLHASPNKTPIGSLLEKVSDDLKLNKKQSDESIQST